MALGFHEHLGDNSSTPPFLQVLRHMVFSRTYSADENCSIFLGRPPRMLKHYCTTAKRPEQWSSSEEYSYRVDTRIHSICASLKEDVLDLQREHDAVKAQKSRRV